MPSDQAVRVLVVDDELLARQRLEDLLSGEENVEIVGLIDNGKQAVEEIRNLAPDIIFLDIQMPGKTGIEVLQEVGPDNMPVVIFVTAYDQYALKAFEVAAIDYLLKPFDDERFQQAFERARKVITLRQVDSLRHRLVSLLEGISEPAERPKEKKSNYLERIAVEMRGQIRIVPVAQIDFITASGPYAELHVGKETLLVRERMQTLEERLDPDDFFRIHRSVIVQLDRIEALLYHAGGDYAVRLKDGRRLSVSRSRRSELEERLGLNTRE